MKHEQKFGSQAPKQSSPQAAEVIQFLSTTLYEQVFMTKEALKSVAHKKPGH